ncbi:MAG: DUF6093 family protein [Anaerolineae bacterium]|nr:DUF6093 family protein [Anaerolineae bacterium]
MAKIRNQVSGLLTETCRIEREAGSVGTMGEPLHTWEVVQTGVNCRIITASEQSRSMTQDVGSQETLVEVYRLIAAVGTPFTEDDRVVMADGRVFQVVAVEDGLTDEAYAAAIVTRERV